MGKVTEIRKANGEVMRIIDGEYVIGANSGCFANPSPCRKIINGEYLVEGECNELILPNYIPNEISYEWYEDLTLKKLTLIFPYEEKMIEDWYIFSFRKGDITYNNVADMSFEEKYNLAKEKGTFIGKEVHQIVPA